MNSFFVCLFVAIVFLQTYSVNAGEMPKKLTVKPLTVKQAENFADGMKVNVRNVMDNTSEYNAKYSIDIERCFNASEDGLIKLIPFSEEKMSKELKDIEKRLVKGLLQKGVDKLSETDQEDKLHYCVYLIKSPKVSCYHCHRDNNNNKSDIYGALSIAVPVN